MCLVLHGYIHESTYPAAVSIRSNYARLCARVSTLGYFIVWAASRLDECICSRRFDFRKGIPKLADVHIAIYPSALSAALSVCHVSVDGQMLVHQHMRVDNFEIQPSAAFSIRSSISVICVTRDMYADSAAGLQRQW